MNKKIVVLSIGIPFTFVVLLQSVWFLILIVVSDNQPHARWFFEPALTVSHFLYFTVALAPAQLVYLLFPQILYQDITQTIVFGLAQFLFSWTVWSMIIYSLVCAIKKLASSSTSRPGKCSKF